MKTKEFIASMQNMGFKVDVTKSAISVFNERNDKVADVNREVQYSMWTCAFAFSEMLEEDKEDLFNVMIEYTSTPIEEREKYYIKCKYLANDWNYLNYTEEIGVWRITCQQKTDLFRTQFTLAELPIWVHEMLADGHLVKEEIE